MSESAAARTLPLAEASEPGGQGSPEAPTLPEPGPDGPEPGPEIPNGPLEPAGAPAAPRPEIQPDYSPQPEIPDVSPTPLPEIPRTPAVPPESPGGVPAVSLGVEAEALPRAGEVEAAGCDADVMDLYSQTSWRAEASGAAPVPGRSGYAP